MLVRLLGLEDEAEQAAGTPFTDLQDWQAPYVGLLYHRGMIQGTSYDKFEPEAPCTAQMYAALMLRALGYSDQKSDFTYDSALAFAQKIGLIDNFSCDLNDFRRDDAAQMSRMALELTPKGAQTDLLGQLVEQGVVDEDKAAAVRAESQQIAALSTRAETAPAYEGEVFAALIDDPDGNSISLHGTLVDEGKRARLDGMLSVALADGRSASQQVIVLRDSGGISLSPWKGTGYRDDQVAALLRETSLLSLVMSAVPARSLISQLSQRGDTYTMTLSDGSAQLKFDAGGVPQERTLSLALHGAMYSVTAQTVRTEDVRPFDVPDGYSSYIKISNTP